MERFMYRKYIYPHLLLFGKLNANNIKFINHQAIPGNSIPVILR